MELLRRAHRTRWPAPPAAVAVEGVFTFRNARSALVLGHARGVALLGAAQAGLPGLRVPAGAGEALGGGGRGGGKEAVARMVCSLPRSSSRCERADASDALAVALCHLNQGRASGPARQHARTPAAGAARVRLRCSRTG